MSKHGPRDVRQLRGECHHHDIGMSTRDQPTHPVVCWRGLPDEVRHGFTGAVDQLDTDVFVAPLADAKQPGLASSGVLAWREAKPGCQISPLRKRRGIAHGGEQRRGVDDADTGDGRKPPRLIVVTGQRRQFIVICLDPPIQA